MSKRIRISIAGFSAAVLVNPDSPVKTTKELIAQARTTGGKFNAGALIGALRGNEIQAAFEFLPPVLGQLRAGSLRAVAVSSKTRFSLLPAVPTLDESGLPGYEVISWNGIGAPAKTPRAIVERLNRELHAAVNSPPVKQRFAELGIEQNLKTPEEMRAFVTSEIAKWDALIDTAKILRL